MCVLGEEEANRSSKFRSSVLGEGGCRPPERVKQEGCVGRKRGLIYWGDLQPLLGTVASNSSKFLVPSSAPSVTPR